jgi:sn-glycerol 3-phosphate transport system substrate-binding protein
MMSMSPRPSWVALALAGSLLVAACSSGKSALDSGNDEPADSPVTSPSASPSASSVDDSTGGSAVPTATVAATTTTTPLADLPACPVDALDGADGPVEVVFWHAMANDLAPVLEQLTEAYNSSQDAVRVRLENQTGYESAIDKYIAASASSRPTMIQLPEYALQEFADSDTFVPAGACLEASGYDTGALLPGALRAYEIEGVQWGMPFNVSSPVLFYNRTMFAAAGLDPADPPVSLEELRSVSQALVDSGASATGVALESGADSGGGWFLEQWFGRAGELYSDNGNGRLARSTEVLFDNELGTELLTYLQDLLNDGLAVDVGDNASGTDSLFKLADPAAPAAMAIYSSAGIGSVLNALSDGLVPGLTVDDVGVGPMPGPGEVASAQVGGASLWIVEGKGDAETAAAWDYISYLTSAETQSTWAAGTGYVPIREDAIALEPLATTYADDPRYKVAYDQLSAETDGVGAVSPALGPLRQVRAETARAVATVFGGGDPAAALAGAAEASNALIDSYNARN